MARRGSQAGSGGPWRGQPSDAWEVCRPAGDGAVAANWEEIWRSLESVEFLDLGKVVEYALLLGNATAAAKVGFFLEQHRETLMVEDRHLRALRDLRPRQPHYLDRSKRTPGRLVSEWNLVVPKEVIERSWGEVL